MIIKDRDVAEHVDSDDFSRAGAKAELQMAHYLRRAFGDDAEVLVINDIRLEIEAQTKEALQIDHLVIHRHGLVLIESKSVTGRILVNEHGEWIRSWGGGSRGMPSPVLQAERQAELLKTALRANSEQILDKFMFGKIQKRFGNCPLETIVAISDQGIIDRRMEIPELCKADQVPGRLKDIFHRHVKAGRLITGSLNWNNHDGIMDFSRDERQRIAAFLVDHHYPLNCSQPQPPPKPQPIAPSDLVCPRCGGQLIPRVAKKGKHIGSQFWGCASYPKCRYMTSNEPGAR